MAKIAFVFAFQNDHEVTLRLVHHLLLNGGSHHIELVGVGSNPDARTLSFLRTVSRCKVTRLLYESKLRVAWDMGLRYALSLDKVDFIALCHNDFVPSPEWLAQLTRPLANRFYVPYSNHYGDLAPHKNDCVLGENEGGFCIIIPQCMAGRLLSLPCTLNQFNIDKWVIDSLRQSAVVGYKLGGCYAEHTPRKSVSEEPEVKKVRVQDDAAYANIVKWYKPQSRLKPPAPSTSLLCRSLASPREDSLGVFADDGCPHEGPPPF